MSKDEQGYNGWTNYATWRVQLELVADYVNGMFDSDIEWLEEQANMSVSDMAETLKDMVYECLELYRDQTSYLEGLVFSYACAFLDEVDWRELAQHAIDDLIDEVKYRKEGSEATA